MGVTPPNCSLGAALSPPPGAGPGERGCENGALMDSFGIFLQGLLGVLAFSILMREWRPGRAAGGGAAAGERGLEGRRDASRGSAVRSRLGRRSVSAAFRCSAERAAAISAVPSAVPARVGRSGRLQLHRSKKNLLKNGVRSTRVCAAV